MALTSVLNGCVAVRVDRGAYVDAVGSGHLHDSTGERTAGVPSVARLSPIGWPAGLGEPMVTFTTRACVVTQMCADPARPDPAGCEAAELPGRCQFRRPLPRIALVFNDLRACYKPRWRPPSRYVVGGSRATSSGMAGQVCLWAGAYEHC